MVRQDAMDVHVRRTEGQDMSSRYKAIVAASFEDLENQVNLYLEDGYTVAQPMVVVNGEQLVQVVIKHDTCYGMDLSRYGV